MTENLAIDGGPKTVTNKMTPWPQFDENAIKAVEQVLRSGKVNYWTGPKGMEFEKRFAAWQGSRFAISTSSGTSALHVALSALGIGPGDEVITSPYTFFATAGCIARVGARPVFVDIEPDTFNIDTSQVPGAVSERTKAIIPVHLFGQTAEMDPILALAEDRGLHVIEDAAQAIGATYRGRMAGSMGTVGCFSFFPSKNLGGIGDGGMVVTQDEGLAERIRVLRNHGAKPTYYHSLVGGNFRLDTLQAAALVVKLRHLEGWAAGRRANAARYEELFAGFDKVVTPTVLEHNVSVFNQYVVRVPRRDQLRAFLEQRGVGTAVYYPLGLHEQECFRYLGYSSGDFPHSERAAIETLALPIYTELTAGQIALVADAIKEFLR